MIKEGFVLRQMPGMNLVMPTGSRVKDFGGALMLNETGALIFSSLKEGGSIDETVQRILDTYDVDEAKARADVLKTVTALKEAGVIAE